MLRSEYKVFVYGTLKPGGHYWPTYCAGKVSEVAPAQIYGEIYDLHVGYPGLLLRGHRWVQGFVLTFPNVADFRQLDVLEGYIPGRAAGENEYNRLQVPCFSLSGNALGAVWVYEMTAATVQAYGGTQLEDGNWPVEASRH